MKPHRQIRSHAKVSTETGVSIAAEQDRVSLYADKLDEMKAILLRMPPVERRSLIADAAKWVQGGCQ